MKSVFIYLEEYSLHASTVEAEIIKYVLLYPEKVIEMSIQDLAKSTFTSTSSIVRLSQKLGFNGLKELKKELIKELTIQQNIRCSIEEDVEITDSIDVMSDKILYKHLLALQETKGLLDGDTLDSCVSALVEAKTVYLFGIGASYLVAEDFYYKMIRLGKICVICKDYDLQNLQANNITKQDIAVVFSYSGQTREIVKCCKKMSARGISIISITKFGTSPIAALSTYRLYVTGKEPLIRSGAMSSRMAQLYMIDMLCSRYICREPEEAYTHIHKTQLYKDVQEEG